VSTSKRWERGARRAESMHRKQNVTFKLADLFFEVNISAKIRARVTAPRIIAEIIFILYPTFERKTAVAINIKHRNARDLL
jgi:hypothetical protein